MVGVERFELPTSCSQSRRATRLRYTPKGSTFSVKAADHTCAAAAGQPARLPAREDQSTLQIQVVLTMSMELSDFEPGPCPRCQRTIPLPAKANKPCKKLPIGARPCTAAICSRARPESKSNTGGTLPPANHPSGQVDPHQVATHPPPKPSGGWSGKAGKLPKIKAFTWRFESAQDRQTQTRFTTCAIASHPI